MACLNFCLTASLWCFTSGEVCPLLGWGTILQTKKSRVRSPIRPFHAKSFLTRSVFISRCLVTTSNNGYSSASRLKSCLTGSFLPTTNCCFNYAFSSQTIKWQMDSQSGVFVIEHLHGPRRELRFQQFLYYCMVSVVVGTCFQSRFLASAACSC
jgi:hypothetical protein